jgi:hypothetical protein
MLTFVFGDLLITIKFGRHRSSIFLGLFVVVFFASAIRKCLGLGGLVCCKGFC